MSRLLPLLLLCAACSTNDPQSSNGDLAVDLAVSTSADLSSGDLAGADLSSTLPADLSTTTTISCAEVEAACAGEDHCCVGDEALICNGGAGIRSTCAAPNGLCVTAGGWPSCAAAPAAASCAALPSCTTVAGQDWARDCTATPSGDMSTAVTSYRPCRDHDGAPTSCSDGQCATNLPSCSPDGTSCSGDSVLSCAGGELQLDFTLVCGALGQVCRSSKREANKAGCTAPDAQACDPASFVASCTSASAGSRCGTLGYTEGLACDGVIQVCTVQSSQSVRCCDKDQPLKCSLL